MKPGLHGDVLVTTDRGDDPYRNLIESIERDVLLVAINGQPFYGTTKLMKAAGAQHAEPIRLGRLRRSIQLIYDDVPEADMGWQAVLDDIAAAKADPLGRYFELEKQHGNPNPEKRPLWLMTDKPWDDPKVTGKEVKILPQVVRIPPLDTLVHDKGLLRRRRRQPAARRTAQRPARLLRLGQRALRRRDGDRRLAPAVPVRSAQPSSVAIHSGEPAGRSSIGIGFLSPSAKASP